MDEFELLKPHPDIHALFQHYAHIYFQDKLGACSVEWSSKRMTLCAGTCAFQPAGGGVVIKLSEPLLKYRPVRDLKETLLHEMIHAALFLDGRWREDGDHGPIFKGYAKAINESPCPDHQRPLGGYNVTVYHTMHAEVDEHRKHRWKCQRCDCTVKRAMNRPPQPADCITTRGRIAEQYPCSDERCRHCTHTRTCGGQFDKIAEPEGYKDKSKSKGKGQQQQKEGGTGQKLGGGAASTSSGEKLGGGGDSGSNKGSTMGNSGERAVGQSGSSDKALQQPAAKRPRRATSPSASGGIRPITDWFKRPDKGQQEAAAGKQQQGPEQQPQQPKLPLPARPPLQPPQQQQPTQPLQGEQKQPARTPLEGPSQQEGAPLTQEQLRQRCLEAVMQRLEGKNPNAKHPQQQQQQQQQQRQAIEQHHKQLHHAIQLGGESAQQPLQQRQVSSGQLQRQATGVPQSASLEQAGLPPAAEAADVASSAPHTAGVLTPGSTGPSSNPLDVIDLCDMEDDGVLVAPPAAIGWQQQPQPQQQQQPQRERREPPQQVSCPLCGALYFNNPLGLQWLNEHLDTCLGG